MRRLLASGQAEALADDLEASGGRAVLALLLERSLESGELEIALDGGSSPARWAGGVARRTGLAFARTMITALRRA